MNKVFLSGNLGRDPVQRLCQNGESTVVSFSLGVDSYVKTTSGQFEKKTDWFNVEAWNLSRGLLESLKKGTKVLIEGWLRYDTYEKDGVTRKAAKIVCKNLELCSVGKRAAEGTTTNETAVVDDDIPF